MSIFFGQNIWPPNNSYSNLCSQSLGSLRTGGLESQSIRSIYAKRTLLHTARIRESLLSMLLYHATLTNALAKASGFLGVLIPSFDLEMKWSRKISTKQRTCRGFENLPVQPSEDCHYRSLLHIHLSILNYTMALKKTQFKRSLGEFSKLFPGISRGCRKSKVDFLRMLGSLQGLGMSWISTALDMSTKTYVAGEGKIIYAFP